METNAKLSYEVSPAETGRFLEKLVNQFLEGFTPTGEGLHEMIHATTNEFYYECLLAETGPNGKQLFIEFFIIPIEGSPNAKIVVWLGEEAEGYWDSYEFVDGVSFTLERVRGFEVCRLVEVNMYGGGWCVWWKGKFSSDAGIKTMLQRITTLK